MTPPPMMDIEAHRGIVGDEAVERIRDKAHELRGLKIAHMNSTYYAGGVVEILLSLTGLLNQLGVRTEWRVLRGNTDFFAVTREMHDGLQTGRIELTEQKKRAYEAGFAENAPRNILDHDFVYMHDHHTMGMVAHYRKRGPWIWRCHLDLSAPDPDLIEYLRGYAERFDAAIYILDAYKPKFSLPQYAFLPAIDPLRRKNQLLDEATVAATLDKYSIPTDRPIVTQISRFDRWKDPLGVVDAFEMASREVDATLVLLGNRPEDDPVDNPIFDDLMARRAERVMVLDGSDPILVAAMQQHAAVVLQKSVREGFGLTVSEAMWKGKPVIGGNVGGIPSQIDDGETGYLVNSPEEAAEKIIDLIAHPDRAREMGAAGREKVRKNFLITRLLEQHLDLLTSFEAQFAPKLPA